MNLRPLAGGLIFDNVESSCGFNCSECGHETHRVLRLGCQTAKVLGEVFGVVRAEHETGLSFCASGQQVAKSRLGGLEGGCSRKSIVSSIEELFDNARFVQRWKWSFELLQSASSGQGLNLNADGDLDNMFVPLELIVDEAQGLAQIKTHWDTTGQVRC